MYTIDPDGEGAFNVFCDQKTAGGGWTVFQKRLDGSVDFYRNWDDYKNGFGNLNSEFWLGLDKIYRLTEKKRNRLRVDLEETTGNTAYAEYDMFAVTNETTKYKLSLGMYSGIALGMYMILIYSILSSFLNYSGVACLFRLAVSCKLENSSKFQKELSYFPNVAPILHFNTRLYSGILLQTFLVKCPCMTSRNCW